MQLEAARVVTGLPLYASRNSLYFETGLEPLAERRRRRKLNLFYKIHYNLAPSFLQDIVSPFRRNRERNLRNDKDYILPCYRLNSTTNSFFPSTVKLWDSLSSQLRHDSTLSQFKNSLNSSRNVNKVPSYFHVGDRKRNIFIARLKWA